MLIWGRDVVISRLIDMGPYLLHWSKASIEGREQRHGGIYV